MPTESEIVEPAAPTWDRAAVARQALATWTAVPFPGDWVDDARCAGMPHEIADDLFFPDNGRDARGDVARLCGGCPVQADCRAFAREHDLAGRWGGESQAERRENRLRWSA